MLLFFHSINTCYLNKKWHSFYTSSSLVLRELIHAVHFYLVSEFLSHLFNKRNDEREGSDETKVRFFVEIKINTADDNKNEVIEEEGFIAPCLMAEKGFILFKVALDGLVKE